MFIPVVHVVSCSHINRYSRASNRSASSVSSALKSGVAPLSLDVSIASAMATPSTRPFSTFTIQTSGIGSAIRTATTKNPDRTCPVASTSIPTRAGPIKELPLSVAAYNA